VCKKHISCGIYLGKEINKKKGDEVLFSSQKMPEILLWLNFFIGK